MGSARQLGLLFIVGGYITQWGCSSEAFVELPDVAMAKAWVVIHDAERANIFDVGLAAHVPLEEGARLIALPLSTQELGLTAGALRLAPGQPISVIASFTYEGGVVTEAAPVAFEWPLNLDDCADACLKVVECPQCPSVKTTQVCGSCADPDSITAPILPSSECPEGWDFASAPNRHQTCSMPRPPGISLPCPAGRRWSMRAGACIDGPPCSPPATDPAATTYYVDPSAAAGGDGSLASPFATFPGNLSAATVVLASGVHPGPIVVTGPQLRIVGHGACSVIRASGGADALTLMGASAVVSDVALEAIGGGRALRVDVVTASVSRATISADGVAVAASGLLLLSNSKVESKLACMSECRSRPTLRLDAGARIIDSDIYGAEALQMIDGPLSIRDSRLLSSGGPGVGVRAAATSELILERVAVLDFGDGILDADVAPFGALFSDVLVVTRDLPPQVGVAVSLGTLGDSMPVRMQRIELDAATTALGLNTLDGVLTDVRARAGLTALQSATEVATTTFELERAWLDYGTKGINANDTAVTASDIWMSRSQFRDSNQAIAGIFGGEFGLQADRLHIVASGGQGVAGFDSVRISDLTIRESRISAVARERTVRPPTLIGHRWDIEGSGVGLSLAGTFDLTDIRLAPEPGGTGLTPICALRDANGVARSFDFRRSDNRATIAVLDPEERIRRAQDLSFSSGTVMPKDIARATIDCVQTQPGLTQFPLFHDVVQR